MNYQEKVDLVFNVPIFRFRTLRTIFDCFSTEWGKTNLQQKENMLLRLIDDKHSLQYYIDGYCYFYSNELANKAYVINALPNSLRILTLNVKDERLRREIHKLYITFGEK